VRSLAITDLLPFSLQEAEKAGHHRRPADGQKHVHARFLRVVYLEGIDRGEEGCQQSSRLIMQTAAREIDQPHEQGPQQRGKSAQSDFALAKETRPDVQQPVVKRRVNVLSRVLSDLWPGALSQRDAVSLVGPETLAVQSMRTQGQRQEENQEEQDAGTSISLCDSEVNHQRLRMKFCMAS
jgi:hypothetical protein